MTHEPCETVRLSALAIHDGEPHALAQDQIEEHIQVCPHCRLSIAGQGEVVRLLHGRKRRSWIADVWPGVAQRMGDGSVGPSAEVPWCPLLVMGTLLLAYKILEVAPGIELPWIVKLFPPVLVLAVFSWLRENPFRISTRLVIKGDAQ